jgi:hypothetical protein
MSDHSETTEQHDHTLPWSLTMTLMRLLPPEMAHNVALSSLRTGIWRVGVLADTLPTLAWLAWAVPAMLVLRLCVWIGEVFHV